MKQHKMYGKFLITISLLTLVPLCNSASTQEGVLFLHPSVISSKVNSSADETHLVVDNKNNRLYFVRDFSADKVAQDLYSSSLSSAKEWGLATKYSIDNHSGTSGKKKDDLLQGRTRNVKHKHRKDRTYLWMADNWTPQSTIEEIDGFSIEGRYMYHLNRSEDVLLISQNGKEIPGGEDLYVSLRELDGSWNKPVSLGDVINTEGSEIAPFLSYDGDTLYFSSDGHAGFGGQDIYYSVRKDDSWKNWSVPVNLGNTINTSYSEAYFVMMGDKCYFASNRTGNYEIYQTAIYDAPPVVFNIERKTDVTFNKGNDGSITLINLEPNVTYERIVFYHDEDSTTVRNVHTNDLGMVMINGLISGSYHHFEAFYSNHKAICLDDVLIREPQKNPENVVTTRGIARPAIEKSIVFDLNSSYLDEVSTKTLNELIRKATGSPEYRITIIAGLDRSTGDNYQQWLNQRRVDRIRVYLSNHGVDSSRIKTIILDDKFCS